MIAAVVQRVGDPLAFYTVAATIIPVLFASLVFEAKALDPSDTERWPPFLIAAAVVLFALAGEVAALKVLGTQHPTKEAHALSVLALATTATALVTLPLAKAGARLTEGNPNKIGLLALTIFVVIGAGVALGANSV